MTKNRNFCASSSFFPILMAFRVHKIWPFCHFFPFFDLDSSSKILSKINFTLVYLFFFQTNDQNWTIFSILPYTDGCTKSGHFGTFFNSFPPDSSLKIHFFSIFWQHWGGGILANRPKISKIDPKKPSV